MKRFLLLLSVLLCLSLAACAKDGPAQPDAPDAPPPAEPAQEPAAPAEPIRRDELDVEFAVGDRDTDALLALQEAFPQAFIRAITCSGREYTLKNC